MCIAFVVLSVMFRDIVWDKHRWTLWSNVHSLVVLQKALTGTMASNEQRSVSAFVKKSCMTYFWASQWCFAVVFWVLFFFVIQKEGKELTKEEKQRLRKEKKQQKKGKEKKDDKTSQEVEKEKKSSGSFPPAPQPSAQATTQKGTENNQ